MASVKTKITRSPDREQRRPQQRHQRSSASRSPKIQQGIIYGMQSPTRNWTKIGRVESTSISALRSRWRSLAPLEDPLIVRRAVRVKDVFASEARMQSVFEPQKIEGEKYDVKPYQFCEAMAILADGKWDQDIADFINEVMGIVTQKRRIDQYEEKMWSSYKLVRTAGSPQDDHIDEPVESIIEDGRKNPGCRLTLRDLGVPEDSVLYHMRHDDVTAVVVDPKEQLVKFDGDIVTLRKATRIMQERDQNVLNVAPHNYWKFEGKRLRDIANELRAKLKGG